MSVVKRNSKSPGKLAKPRRCKYGELSHSQTQVLIWGSALLKPRQARAYAAWLLKAADWADAQAERRKGKD